MGKPTGQQRQFGAETPEVVERPFSTMALIDLEPLVEHGFDAADEVRSLQPHVERAALAIVEIHDRRLYLETDESFEAYLRRRWNRSKTSGYRMLDHGRVLLGVSPPAALGPGGPLPSGEPQEGLKDDKVVPNVPRGTSPTVTQRGAVGDAAHRRSSTRRSDRSGAGGTAPSDAGAGVPGSTAGKPAPGETLDESAGQRFGDAGSLPPTPTVKAPVAPQTPKLAGGRAQSVRDQWYAIFGVDMAAVAALDNLAEGRRKLETARRALDRYEAAVKGAAGIGVAAAAREGERQVEPRFKK